jgi:hypothetical protein
MRKYLDRETVRKKLDEKGVKIGKTALANMASDGTGPDYVLINGRALYTEEALDAWLNNQASKAPRRRRRSAAGNSQTATA